MDTPFGMSAMSAFSYPGPKPPRPAAAGPVRTGRAHLAGMDVVLDPTGALYWPAEDLLVVSDLHLETGSSYARTGQMLPPYDTTITLRALSAAVARHRPARVISLGDTFHDPYGAERLLPADRATLAALTEAADVIWVTGNHERDGAASLGGEVCEAVTIGGTTFRHIPSAEFGARGRGAPPPGGAHVAAGPDDQAALFHRLRPAPRHAGDGLPHGRTAGDGRCFRCPVAGNAPAASPPGPHPRPLPDRLRTRRHLRPRLC